MMESICPGASHNGFNLIVLVGDDVVPGYIHRLVRMCVQKHLQQFSNFLPALPDAQLGRSSAPVQLIKFGAFLGKNVANGRPNPKPAIAFTYMDAFRRTLKS